MPLTLLSTDVFGDGANPRTSTSAGTSGGRGMSRPTSSRGKITTPHGHRLGAHIVGRR